MFLYIQSGNSQKVEMKNINKLRVNGLSFGDLPARVDGMGRKSGPKTPSGRGLLIPANKISVIFAL